MKVNCLIVESTFLCRLTSAVDGMAQFKSREDYDRIDYERYKNKQREIFERRRVKLETEGYKCKQEGCQQSFRDKNEYYDHINQHKTKLRDAMICNHPNCGIKFDKKKEYLKHIDQHKADDKRKIVNSIR